jgi:hypothetical protein
MKRWTNGLPGATKRLGANLALRGLSASQPGCARIPMMARSKIAPLQRPNTLLQLSRSSVLELRLATHGRAIHFGTELRSTVGTGRNGNRPVDLAPHREDYRHIFLQVEFFYEAEFFLNFPQGDARGFSYGRPPLGLQSNFFLQNFPNVRAASGDRRACESSI